MTREEALTEWVIPAIKRTWNEKRCKEIIKALEQELCDDCISRQIVISTIYDNKSDFKNDFSQGFFADKIRDLPSVQPEQKIGHWRDTGSGQECSECGEIQYGYDNFRHFCANCGRRMEVYDATNN